MRAGPVTDLLRFDGSGDVYFFSTDGVGTPAYVPALPAVIRPSQGPFFPESMGVQSFMFSYAPTPGQPGYNSETIYDITVDVPEPSVLALASLGGGLLCYADSSAGPSAANSVHSLFKTIIRRKTNRGLNSRLGSPICFWCLPGTRANNFSRKYIFPPHSPTMRAWR